MYNLAFTRRATKDSIKLARAGLKNHADVILDILEKNPNPPNYEKLKGDLRGAFSRRINIQHRLVYQVFEKEKVLKILSLWSHYEQQTHVPDQLH